MYKENFADELLMMKKCAFFACIGQETLAHIKQWLSDQNLTLPRALQVRSSSNSKVVIHILNKLQLTQDEERESGSVNKKVYYLT
jgi:hypothetical protein